MKRLRLSRLDQSARIKDKDTYEKRLGALQMRMLGIQQAFYHQKRRGIVAVEGWDAAGKGGMIRRLNERLDPRGLKVWPIGPPEAAEQARHYLYRFWTKLPEPGTVAVFDRSWYGRVLVERVEGLAAEDAWRRAYREINDFERMLVDDGVALVKIFLHITPDEQLRRFAERLTNPYKRWKLTDADLRAHAKWDEYVDAIEDMLARTSTARVPWTVIPANHKWYARVASLQAIADVFGKGVPAEPPVIDAKIRTAALRLLGRHVRALKAKKRKQKQSE